MSVKSAAHGRATSTPLRASSGCKGSEAILVAWRRHPHSVSVCSDSPSPHVHCLYRLVCDRNAWHVCIHDKPEARVFVATGSPIQPHSSDGLEGLDVRFSWVKVPQLVFAHCGFPEWLASIDRFCQYYSIVNPVEARMHVPAYLHHRHLHPYAYVFAPLLHSHTLYVHY